MPSRSNLFSIILVRDCCWCIEIQIKRNHSKQTIFYASSTRIHFLCGISVEKSMASHQELTQYCT